LDETVHDRGPSSWPGAFWLRPCLHRFTWMKRSSTATAMNQDLWTAASIRQATAADTRALVETLTEAADWVEWLDGTTMWVEGELEEHRVRAQADAGM